VLLLDNNWGLPGTLPSSWAQLPLRVLSLGNTNIQGSLPASWADVTANSTLRSTLQQLYLHRTHIDGEIPAAWYTGFFNLTAFTVWGSNVCGRHPSAASGLGSMCLDTTGTRLGELVVYHHAVFVCACQAPMIILHLVVLPSIFLHVLHQLCSNLGFLPCA
jgi:hypothetical protein